MKAFVIYTGLRIGIFLACYAVLVGAWALVSGAGSLSQADFVVLILVAAVASMALSWKFLAKQREALARSVEQRANAATQRFEKLRSAEDSDES